MEMKKIVIKIGALFLVGITYMSLSNYSYAADNNVENLSATVYEMEEDDGYDISKGILSGSTIDRFTVSGPISSVQQKDGVQSYAVDVEENEKLDIRIENLTDCVEEYKNDGWENDSDNAKKLDTISLNGKIKSGSIVIQTSRDGEIWTTAESYVDVFNDGLQELQENDEPLYSTTNVELNNGCYYRILVAYKIKKQVEDSKILVVNVKNYEYLELVEVSEFYAYNENVDLSDTLSIDEAYELGELVRCKQSKGYYGSEPIDSKDPHNNWKIGDFYISGYTAFTEDSDKIPVFLKEVGDKVTLWFNLEQNLDKCNSNSEISIVADSKGQDQEFRSPTMDFGRGMLIVQKTDNLNKTTTQYYKNYLEASASVGANTKIDLFEEGDYEVALDYALKYDKREIRGRSVLPKTIHYRVSFQFSVRNGDCKLFIRDAVTDAFIDNANIAENGFYLDLAKQKYLDLSIKREVMTDSLDGLVADTKFNAAGKEGRVYTDEGVYTITATNKYTSAQTEKKIYVGDSDILKAYMTTGISIAKIKEMLSQGAYIDENWNIVEPTFK